MNCSHGFVVVVVVRGCVCTVSSSFFSSSSSSSSMVGISVMLHTFYVFIMWKIPFRQNIIQCCCCRRHRYFSFHFSCMCVRASVPLHSFSHSVIHVLLAMSLPVSCLVFVSRVLDKQWRSTQTQNNKTRNTHIHTHSNGAHTNLIRQIFKFHYRNIIQIIEFNGAENCHFMCDGFGLTAIAQRMPAARYMPAIKSVCDCVLAHTLTKQKKNKSKKEKKKIRISNGAQTNVHCSILCAIYSMATLASLQYTYPLYHHQHYGGHNRSTFNTPNERLRDIVVSNASFSFNQLPSCICFSAHHALHQMHSNVRSSWKKKS